MGEGTYQSRCNPGHDGEGRRSLNILSMHSASRQHRTLLSIYEMGWNDNLVSLVLDKCKETISPQL